MHAKTGTVKDLHDSIALTEDILDALEAREESGGYEYGMDDHRNVCAEIAWFNNFLRLLREMGGAYDHAC